MASPTNRSWQTISLFILFFCLTTIVIESKLQVPFQEFVTPPPAISKQIYYLTDYCEICEKFRPEFTRVPRPPPENETSSSPLPPPSEAQKTLERDDENAGIDDKTKLSKTPKKDENEPKKLPEKKESSLSSPSQSGKDVDSTKPLRQATKTNSGETNTNRTDDIGVGTNGAVTTEMTPVEESSTSTTLKRVPRNVSPSKQKKRNSCEEEKEEEEKKPEIVMLEYDKKSFNDSDLNANGTWSWRKAFKRIKAKWIEKYDNDTSKQVENKFIAKFKETQTPEGDKQKKMILEFKKKIQNLTLLNPEDMLEQEEEVDDGNDYEDISKNKKEDEKVLVKRDLKQIFLDPIAQPSIVIRKKRSTTATSNPNVTNDNQADNDDDIPTTTMVIPTVVLGFDEKKVNNSPDIEENSEKKKKNGTYEKCRLLIRFKNVDNNTLISLANGNNQTTTEATTTNLTSTTTVVPLIMKQNEIDTGNDETSSMKTDDKDKLVTSSTTTIIPEISDKRVETTTKSVPTFQSTTISTLDNETKPEDELAPKPTTANTELGFLINIRKFVGSILSSVEADFNRTQQKMDKNPFWKNIRIFTSDPNNTEYWYQGKKMDTKPKKDDNGSSRSKRSIKENSFIDSIDMNDIVKLLTENDGVDFDIANEKWILLERKIFFDDPDDDDDEELIINLFLKPKQEVVLEPKESNNHRNMETKSEKLTLRCPAGTFDCESDGSLCIPNSLKCNGEDNCGNGRDELRSNCPSALNLFYVYNENPESMTNSNDGSFLVLDSNTQGMFWFSTRVLFILFATCLFLYILLLLCRMCDRLRTDPTNPMFIIPKGNYISISGDTIERRQWPSSVKGSRPGGVGSNMDTHGSRIKEYIYVNNNYGQPQGSTVVSTNLRPPNYKNNNNKWYNRFQNSSTSPDATDDEYPPLYEDTIRQYGTKK